MATEGKNLSAYDPDSLRQASLFRIGLVVSEWNPEITEALLSGARSALLDSGFQEVNIPIVRVPGSFELPLACQLLIDNDTVDAVVAIGSVIRGETPHFEYVCQAVSAGIKDVGLKTGIPVIFCVLTDNTIEQSRDRSGGKHGNKGVEAAVAAVKMASLRKELREGWGTGLL